MLIVVFLIAALPIYSRSVVLIIVLLIAVLLIHSRAALRILRFILLLACTSSHTEESTKAIFS